MSLDAAVSTTARPAAPPPPATGADLAAARGGRSDPATCVSIAVDEEHACVVRLRGPLGRGALARVEAVLQALESVSRLLVVDLARARTGDRRLLRVVAEVAGRRHRAGHRTRLRAVHPGALPDLESVSLPEAFLVYEAVCLPSP